jgi:hypothetical protein
MEADQTQNVRIRAKRPDSAAHPFPTKLVDPQGGSASATIPF